jgi:hypothetical protein
MNIRQLRTNDTSNANHLTALVDRASSFRRCHLWAFYFHDALSYRIRYCDCILYRQVGQGPQE